MPDVVPVQPRVQVAPCQSKTTSADDVTGISTSSAATPSSPVFMIVPRRPNSTHPTLPPRLSQSLPTKDSGLTLGESIAAVARHICPKEAKLRRQLSAGHGVGGEHERFGNSNPHTDFGLGARADAWRLPHHGATSAHRLIDCPRDGLNEQPHPTDHHHCNGGEKKQFDHAGTHNYFTLKRGDRLAPVWLIALRGF